MKHSIKTSLLGKDSGALELSRRLVIRAARFGPEADFSSITSLDWGIDREANEGRISSKSLKSLAFLFSIPTAPTKYPLILLSCHT